MTITQYIKSIRSLFSRPFPEASNLSTYIKTLFLIAIFVSLFLGLIRPFNMNDIEDSTWKYSLIFGAITFISGVGYELILRFIFKLKKEGDNYTFIKWMLQVIGLMIFISLFNYLYISLEFGMPLDGLLYMMWATFLVGVFPTVFIGTISMLKSERSNSEIAATLNKKTNINQSTVNDSTIFDIAADKIWAIESLQNYVNIYYWNGTTIEKKTERSTLKSCEEQIASTSLVRCHRSYIVNTSQIENISGNAQGLKLKLSDFETLIPVSRSYIPLFKA